MLWLAELKSKITNKLKTSSTVQIFKYFIIACIKNKRYKTLGFHQEEIVNIFMLVKLTRKFLLVTVFS